MAVEISAWVERWPIAGTFTISRGSKREAVVVVVEARDQGAAGRGECVPYQRYGESIDTVLAAIEAARGVTDRHALQRALPAGAARNAIDCALIDLECRLTGQSASSILGLSPPAGSIVTCYTLSLDTPAAMAQRARDVPHLPLLKLKLGGEGDEHRMRAVREARPDARLVADANESWSASDLERLLDVAAQLDFELIEQPLPAENDGALAGLVRPVPVCADESAHTTQGLDALRNRYDAVNIKLDKTGGITEAVAMARAARALSFKTMLGCMVATSLSMAPALLLADGADWVDLDGPLLLETDREGGLVYDRGRILADAQRLWG